MAKTKMFGLFISRFLLNKVVSHSGWNFITGKNKVRDQWIYTVWTSPIIEISRSSWKRIFMRFHIFKAIIPYNFYTSYLSGFCFDFSMNKLKKGQKRVFGPKNGPKIKFLEITNKIACNNGNEIAHTFCKRFFYFRL